MKLLYAPDCSDHPNWGCRYMGDWYRNALAAVPGVNLRRIGSRWFFQQDARIPAPANFGELQRIAETAHRNDALANVAAALAACDCLFMNAENFIRPLTLKGRRLLMLAYLAKTVFAKPVLLANASLDLSEPALAELVAQVLPLLDEVQLRDDTSATRYAALRLVLPDEVELHRTYWLTCHRDVRQAWRERAVIAFIMEGIRARAAMLQRLPRE